MFGRGCWGCTRGTRGQAGRKGEPWGGKHVAGAPLDGFQPAAHSFRILKGGCPLTLFQLLNQAASGAANLSASTCVAHSSTMSMTLASHTMAQGSSRGKGPPALPTVTSNTTASKITHLNSQLCTSDTETRQRHSIP